MIIIAPPTTPQIAAAKPPPPPKATQLDWIDERILALIRDSEPLKLWTVLNLVTEALSPRSRAEGREVRLRLLARIEALKKLGLLHRTGRNTIVTLKPAAKARRVRMSHRKQTVKKAPSEKAVSAVIPRSSPEQGSRPIPFRAEVFASSPGGRQPPPTGPKTQSAPDPAQIRQAAKSLARLPRNQPRRLTGWIGDKRVFRDTAIVLPNGTRAWVFGALRQQVIFTLDKGRLLGTLTPKQRWGVLPASEVDIVRSPHASALGRLKAGTIERRSEAKARATRLNGLRPCRPGKRRGRPARVPTQPHALARGGNLDA